MFLVGISAVSISPILNGIDKIVFSAGAALTRWNVFGEIASLLGLVVGVLLIFTAHTLNALDWRLARRQAPDIAHVFAKRQAHFVGGTLLCWLMTASLNHLEQTAAEEFLGAAVGVLAALLLLVMFDARFTPQDLVEVE